MPNTKPDLSFDKEGVCDACLNFNSRVKVDWEQRKSELQEIVKKFRNQSVTNWDCIVPVSGGKDSTYQVVQMLEFGLRPLCVNATTCDLSSLGRRNLDNIKSLGVDLVEYSCSPTIRRKLNKIGLTDVGDISWPEHVAIFTIPVRAAVDHGVPLIVWGENSQNEYGGPAADAGKQYLDKRWLDEFGGLLGLRVSDVVGLDGITKQDLINYNYPTDAELRRVGVSGIFLGHFIPWDGEHNAKIAQRNGFEVYHSNVEGSYTNYENLDNHQTGIHDYFKYLKYGFGRASDQVSLAIRRGRITRKDGLEYVKKYEGKFPKTYIGKPLAEILAPLCVSMTEFENICDRFTNRSIFLTENNGELLKDEEGNLTKVNYDNIH